MENQALNVKNRHLVCLVSTLHKDVEDLQNEIGELQILVEDLRCKVVFFNTLIKLIVEIWFWNALSGENVVDQIAKNLECTESVLAKKA